MLLSAHNNVVIIIEYLAKYLRFTKYSESTVSNTGNLAVRPNKNLPNLKKFNQSSQIIPKEEKKNEEFGEVPFNAH